jgi:hypothetical protein
VLLDGCGFSQGAEYKASIGRRIEMTSDRWIKRIALLLIMAAGTSSLTACGYLAAGAAGAAIGHEVAEDDDED